MASGRPPIVRQPANEGPAEYAPGSNRAQTADAISRTIDRNRRFAEERGLIVNAGHGLKYHNTRAVAKIKGIDELNIGHSVISRGLFVGLANAVKEMKRLVTV